MSSLHETHTAYELAEQYVADQYWPAGGAAADLRAELIGLMLASSMASDHRTAERIKTIWELLGGNYNAEKATQRKKPPGKEDMKAAFGIT